MDNFSFCKRYFYNGVHLVQGQRATRRSEMLSKRLSFWGDVWKITVWTDYGFSDWESIHLGVGSRKMCFMGRSCPSRTHISLMEYEGNECDSLECALRLDLVELRSVFRLNTFHWNSDRTARVLQRFVCEKGSVR